MAEQDTTVELSLARTSLCAVVSLLDVADPSEAINVGELYSLLAPIAKRIDDLVWDVCTEVSKLETALANANATAQVIAHIAPRP